MHGDNRSDSVTVGLTHVFDPSLTSETLFAFTYVDFENVFDNPEAVSRQGVGYPYGGVFGESRQIPAVDASFNGQRPVLRATSAASTPCSSRRSGSGAPSRTSPRCGGRTPRRRGLFWEYVENKQPGSNNDNGHIGLANWGWNSTGNTLADLLIGNVTYYFQSQRNVLHDIAYHRIEGYLQDSWKVRPRLTIDGGVRIAWIGPAYDRGGRASWSGTRTATARTPPPSDLPGWCGTRRIPRCRRAA